MTPQQTDIIERLIRCAGSGMNWLDHVSNAKLKHQTRAVLSLDMALCNQAIMDARLMLAKEREKPQLDEIITTEVPKEIMEAALKLERWHIQQGINKWKLAGVQSREN